jgi:ketosteroid isomerase-like protein/3-phenylpropionate/cinnamic acid dioxygenase small subunit
MTDHAHQEAVDPVAVVERYLSCISDLDVDGALVTLADDVIIEMPFAAAGGTRMVEGEAAHQFVAALPKVFTQMRFYDVVVHGLTQSGVVVAEFKSDGITRRGTRYPNRYVAVFEVDDGRITTLREYFDPNVLAAAFGPSSPKAEPAELTLEDRNAIAELMARYGNIIDERQYSRIGEVFTADAHYDVADYGLGVVDGTEAITRMWTDSATHPLAHHVTNVEITADGTGVVRVYSKIIGVGAKGRVGSATYHDVVTRTAEGWRISERVVTARRTESLPENS